MKISNPIRLPLTLMLMLVIHTACIQGASTEMTQEGNTLTRITDPAAIQALRVKYQTPPLHAELICWLEDQPEVARAEIGKRLFSNLPQMQFEAVQIIASAPWDLKVNWDPAWYEQVKTKVDLPAPDVRWTFQALCRLDPRRAFTDLQALLAIPDLQPELREAAIFYMRFCAPQEAVASYLQDVISKRKSPKGYDPEIATAREVLLEIYRQSSADLRTSIASFFLQQIRDKPENADNIDLLNDLAQWPSEAQVPFLKQALETTPANEIAVYAHILRAYTRLRPLAARDFLVPESQEEEWTDEFDDCIPIAWAADPEKGYQVLLAGWEAWQPKVPEDVVGYCFQLGGEEMARRFIATLEEEDKERAIPYLEEFLLPIGPSHPLRVLSDKLHAAEFLTMPLSDAALDSMRKNNTYRIEWNRLLLDELPTIYKYKELITQRSHEYRTLAWAERLRPHISRALGAPFEELRCRSCLIRGDIPHYFVYQEIAYGCKDANGNPCKNLPGLADQYNAMLADAGAVERLYFIEDELGDVRACVLPPQRAETLFAILGFRPM